MKKVTSLLLAVMLAMTLLAGCTGNGGSETTTAPTTSGESATTAPTQESTTAPTAVSGPKEIRIARAYDITTLDAHEANDNGSYEILRLIGEGLVRLNGGEIAPGVAERWDVSEDGLEYIFHLREDAV